MIAGLAALALAASPPRTVAGAYHTRQMEVGAELLLNSDGSFLYSLDYGAVSEAGQGRWTARDGAVHLDSKPLPIALMREIERSDAAFHDQPLAIDDGALVLRRWDTIFTFFKDDE